MEPLNTQFEFQSRNECRNTTIYCVLSILFFIVVGMLNSPGFSEALPGGQLTASLLSIVIFIAVLFLCIKQAPRL